MTQENNHRVAETAVVSGHTKGPWMMAARPSSIVGWPVVAPHAGGRSICGVTYFALGKGFENHDRESESNARLIAAAPDGLAAAIAADEVLAAHDFDAENSPRAELRAFIAKAASS